MAIIKQKEKGILVVVSGPSGAGKDSIMNEVIKNKRVNAWISISMTSRLPRGKEENGKDYFFVETNILPSFISSNYGDLIEEN